MKKSEVKQLFLSRGKIAEDIMETYFLTSDGTPINLGSRINCCGEIERSVEHNSCFDLFKCSPRDWGKFFHGIHGTKSYNTSKNLGLKLLLC